MSVQIVTSYLLHLHWKYCSSWELAIQIEHNSNSNTCTISYVICMLFASAVANSVNITGTYSQDLACWASSDVLIEGGELRVEWGSMHQYHAVSPAGTSFCGNFCIHIKCEVKHNWDMGMEHLWFKWVGHLWQSELLFRFVLGNNGDVRIGHL